MNKLFLSIIILAIINLPQTFSQTKCYEILHQSIHTDTLLQSYSFHLSPKVLKIDANKVCDYIKQATSNSISPLLSPHQLEQMHIMEDEALELFLCHYEDSILMLEPEKYALYFICRDESGALFEQIKANNKKKRHCLKYINKTTHDILIAKGSAKEYFLVSSPIFLNNETHALILKQYFFGGQYGFEKVEIYKKDSLNKWKKKHSATVKRITRR